MKRFLSVLLCAALLLPSLMLKAPQEANALDTSGTTQDTYIGNVDLNGDASFDCDSIANSDDDQWRWMSYPESRMVINPGNRPQYDGGMNLNIGLFVNGVQSLKSLQKVQMAATGQSAHDWTSLTTVWYPYKLTAHAVYGSDGTVDMSEFFVDKNTYVRYIEASGVAGKTMTMSASISGLSVLSDGSMLIDADNYYFVYKVMLLNDDSSINQILAPTVNGSVWTVNIPFTSDTAKIAFSLTLAAKVDDSTTATVISRSNDAVSGKMTDKLAATKAFWDAKLAKVPAPTVWGIQCDTIDNLGVTAAQNRRSFYAAWSYKYQNILEPTPETGYNNYQVTLGKASLWSNGATKAPNSCSWESMFDIQQLSMVEPDIAWDAAKGFINSIGDDGILDGECLPSQKAHMTWVCYENKKAYDKLHNIDDSEMDQELPLLYEKIKKYLIWRASNPRWIFSGHNYSDEKDISFVAEWYSDVGYAMKICQVLGETADIGMWENMEQTMDENVREWFFTPDEGDSSDIIYNSCFTDHDTHYYGDRTTDVPNYIYSALYANLPSDLTDKLVSSYLNFQDSSKPLVGFTFYKYGDGCHIAYGLLEKSTQYPELKTKFKEFINSALAYTIKNVEFSEGLGLKGGNISIDGVIPSTFGTSTVIDYTYMNNGMRLDLGTPTVISDGKTGLQKASNSDVTLNTLVNTPVSLPKTVTALDSNGNSVQALVAWDAVDDNGYVQAGTYTVNGTLADTDIPVTATINVYDGTIDFTPITAQTTQGTVPSLPTVLSATYQQNSSTQDCYVNVTWDPMTTDEFSNLGTVTVSGKINETGQSITAAVTVDPPSAIETATGSDTVDQYQTLQLTAKDGQGQDLDVTWSIQNSDYDAPVGINQNGLLLAVKAGTVTVVATPTDGQAPLTKNLTILSRNVPSFAYGSTATASGEADTARNASKGIDENEITMWRAANNNDSQWYQVEMKQSVPVTGVKIRWYEGDQPQAFVLKVSEDGTNWQTVSARATKVDTGKTDYSEIMVFDQTVNAKYVKMESSQAGNYPMGIIEYQIYADPTITVPVSNLQINSSSNTFDIQNKGVCLNLSASVTPSDATDARVEWTVTNADGTATDLASISSAGVLTPLKNGTVLVTAKAVDGSGATAAQTVTMTNQDISNVALNKPATATSSGGGSNSPSAAIDGNPTTRWGSASGASQSSFFQIDLQGEYIISTVSLSYDTGAYPIDYQLQYSMDGTNWTDLANITGSTDTSKTFIFNPVHAKYVRTLSSKTSNSSWAYSIFEFEVYGRPIAQIADLQTLYDNNKNKANDNYTAATWNAFQQALSNAQSVLANADATQDTVNAANTALQQAIDGLTKAVDKTALQSLFDSSKDKANDNYTTATWNAFQQALNNAQSMLANADATQDTVNAANTALQQAIVCCACTSIKSYTLSINDRYCKSCCQTTIEYCNALLPKGISVIPAYHIGGNCCIRRRSVVISYSDLRTRQIKVLPLYISYCRRIGFHRNACSNFSNNRDVKACILTSI